MWTAAKAAQIHNIARRVIPDIKSHSIPQGLQAEKVPGEVVEYFKEQLLYIISHW